MIFELIKKYSVPHNNMINKDNNNTIKGEIVAYTHMIQYIKPVQIVNCPL